MGAHLRICGILEGVKDLLECDHCARLLLDRLPDDAIRALAQLALKFILFQYVPAYQVL